MTMVSGPDAEPIKADFAQVPVPPEDAEGAPAPPPAVAPAAEDVAAIEFLAPDDRPREIVFAHPFRFEGREIRGATVRHMTLAEVIRVFEAAPRDAGDSVPLVHFYAAMTGLPAPVIRALAASDHEALLAACYPFLPRSITGASSKSTEPA